MKQCAIVRNGKDIIKITNLKRKLPKIDSNPDMSIIEECDLNEVDDRLVYWRSQLAPTATDIIDENEIIKYRFVNRKTGEYITSIYPDLHNLVGLVSNLEDYEREK